MTTYPDIDNWPHDVWRLVVGPKALVKRAVLQAR
jgi:hypothetical protein